MSTSKHIDRICIAVIAITLVITIIFMNASKIGIAAADRVLGYETRLFSTDRVHTIDIVMDDWDSFIETCENEEYSACAVVIDGESYKNVGIRAKGNTSLSSVRSMGSQRYSFKIEFDQYDDTKSYHGLDKICLNNLIQDNTMMKDYIAYQLMDDFSVDAPLSSFVYITVNGEEWGLYLAVEAIEDGFLERNYGSETGDLYKPDTMNFGGGRGNGKDFNMDDFTKDMEDMMGGSSFDFSFPGSGEGSSFDFSFPGGGEGSSFDFNFGGGGGFNFGGFGMGSDDVKLKYIDDAPDSYSNIFNSAKTVVTNADKARLINSLKNLSEYTNLEETLDMDEVLRYFVVHNFLCNGDSYTGSMIHNYYLRESEGKLSMIPWDYNLAFGTFSGGNGSSSINASIDNPLSGGNVDDRPMIGWIFSSEEYTDAYHELFSEFIDEWFSSGQLEQMVHDTADMIRPYVEKDPTKFCTIEEFETGVDTMVSFVSLRGEAIERQLAGDNTAVDTTGLNLSDMGSMGGGFNRGGDSGRRSSSENKDNTADRNPSDKKDSSGGRSFSEKRDSSDGRNFSEKRDSSGGRNFSNKGEASGDRSSFNPGDFSDFGNMPDVGRASPSKGNSTLILVLASFAVLGAGLLVAIKKKY